MERSIPPVLLTVYRNCYSPTKEENPVRPHSVLKAQQNFPRVLESEHSNRREVDSFPGSQRLVLCILIGSNKCSESGVDPCLAVNGAELQRKVSCKTRMRINCLKLLSAWLGQLHSACIFSSNQKGFGAPST